MEDKIIISDLSKILKNKNKLYFLRVTYKDNYEKIQSHLEIFYKEQEEYVYTFNGLSKFKNLDEYIYYLIDKYKSYQVKETKIKIIIQNIDKNIIEKYESLKTSVTINLSDLENKIQRSPIDSNIKFCLYAFKNRIFLYM